MFNDIVPYSIFNSILGGLTWIILYIQHFTSLLQVDNQTNQKTDNLNNWGLEGSNPSPLIKTVSNTMLLTNPQNFGVLLGSLEGPRIIFHRSTYYKVLS